MAEPVGVALAAGAGRRLRPLTDLRPKPLCPVGNVALLDGALDRLAAVAGEVVVNVHHGRLAMEEHLAGRTGGWIDADGTTARGPASGTPGAVLLSVEPDEALGTAGALGRLRPYLGERPVVAVNADTWCPAPLDRLLDGWDGERIRVLVRGEPSFVPGVEVIGSLMPAWAVAELPSTPSGLYRTSWRPAAAEGRLEAVGWEGPFADCGTPARYLAGNLLAARPAGGSLIAPDAVVTGTVERSVIGAGAVVDGSVRDAVVWPGARVEPGEDLERAIRVGEDLTVLVR